MFFQNVTKDHKCVLLKQKEDIGYLCRHLDHVISFAELATSRNQGMAFLHCKRLVRLPHHLSTPRMVLAHECFNLKIINILPSVADCVSDGKPLTGKVQHILCATEHHTLSGSNLLLGFHY